MSDPRDDIWEGRADRAYSKFTEHPVRTGAKWYLWLLAAVIGLALLGGVIGLIGGWFSGTAQLASFDHSKEQTTAVLDDWTSLQAAAGNACEAKASKAQPGDPTLIESPSFAYDATYRRIKADYDRRMNNLFEAYVTRHLPLPGSIHSLPRIAPTLSAMEQEVC